jgi:hypothetical protein
MAPSRWALERISFCNFGFLKQADLKQDPNRSLNNPIDLFDFRDSLQLQDSGFDLR